MSEKKRTYSTEAYLTPDEFAEFFAILKEEKISSQELTNIEGLGHRRETMNVRLRRKRIRREFANKVLEAKSKESEGKMIKFKEKRF